MSSRSLIANLEGPPTLEALAALDVQTTTARTSQPPSERHDAHFNVVSSARTDRRETAAQDERQGTSAAPAVLMFSSATGRTTSAIAALRDRVAYLEHNNAQLNEREQQAEERHRADLAARDRKCLQYCRQVDALSRNLELVLEKSLQLERDLDEVQQQRDKAQERVIVLVRYRIEHLSLGLSLLVCTQERNGDTLRQLMMQCLSTPSSAKHERRSVAEQKFWDALATPQLLQETEPPASLCVRLVAYSPREHTSHAL